MEKVRPQCGQPSDRGRLKNRTEQNIGITWRIRRIGLCGSDDAVCCCYKQVTTVLLARSRIAAAPLRIKLKILTAGSSEYPRVLLPKVHPFWCGDPGPHLINTCFRWTLECTTHRSKRHLDRLISFCRVHACDQQTQIYRLTTLHV